MTTHQTAALNPPPGRWLQLLIGIVCMVMIANLQYGWTLFVEPIGQKHGWDRASIQVAFTIFVLTETWLVPIEGWFVDRYGPKIVVVIGGVLVGISWMLNAYRQHARHALHLRRDRRHRRRRRLRHLRRQRAEMVSRQARPGGRPDRCRLRRRLGAHHHPDPGHDPQLRLRGDLLLVRSRPGPGGLRPGLVASRPAARPGAGLGARAAIGAELHARSRCCARRSSG